MDILDDREIPEDFKACIRFHGHLCPGIVYGYRVSREAIRMLGLKRADDEEIVSICENDSCAVDAFQVLLGTTAGKGNLIICDYGKNAYTVISRKHEKAYRFSRKKEYVYRGREKAEFEIVEQALAAGTATRQQQHRQKLLKSLDLLARPFDDIFETRPADLPVPEHAQTAPSRACAGCGEMTMATRMKLKNGKYYCTPCFNKI